MRVEKPRRKSSLTGSRTKGRPGNGWLSAIILAGMVISPMAEGSLIEFTFGGQLEQVIGSPPAPWDGVGVGSIFSVSYIFDTETPDLDNSPAFGIYDILSLKVTMDGATQATSTGQIRVDIQQPFLQRYEVNFSGLPNGSNGVIRLTGALVLESDNLPMGINLNEWTIGQSFQIALPFNYLASGVITTFSSRIVPAPGVFIPLGIMGLAFRRTRNRH